MLQVTAETTADNGPQPDAALVAAAAETPEAFGLLYDRYLAGVYRYVLARTGSREDAADLTQLTFARAFHSLSGYRPGRAPFVAWLFRIARNTVTDAHRRRRITVSLDGLPEVLVSANGLGPEELAEKRERLDRLRGLLAAISRPKRELLALRFGSGLSVREIAPIVGKSEAAVKKQLTRTIATLKEYYRDDPEESGYKDLIGEADPAGAKLAADLQALYAAPAPGLRFTPPPELPARLPGARRWRRWQPAMAAAVAVAGLAAVLIAPSLWQTESRVNAETVFARASTVAETSAPADGPAAYHLIATTETPGKAGTSTTETWYADSSHIRSEQDYDPANAGADFGTLVRGDQAWLYGSIDGVYRAVHGPASELGVGFVGGMPGSGTATDLSQVLGQYTGGCQVARADGEDTIVGRAAYKIAVTMDFNTCPVPDAKADPGKMGPLTLWVDRETFLPLKTEQLDTAGGMMYVYEVTQIEVGGPIPDSAFEYVPPVGVAVQDVANLTEAKFILSGYTKDGVPAQ